MWRDILLANREELLLQARLVKQALGDFERAMQADDGQAVEDLITLASATRTHWRMGAQRTNKNVS